MKRIILHSGYVVSLAIESLNEQPQKIGKSLELFINELNSS